MFIKTVNLGCKFSVATLYVLLFHKYSEVCIFGIRICVYIYNEATLLYKYAVNGIFRFPYERLHRLFRLHLTKHCWIWICYSLLGMQADHRHTYQKMFQLFSCLPIIPRIILQFFINFVKYSLIYTFIGRFIGFKQ